MKKRLLTMLVLLAAVATGAVAQTTYKVSVKEGTEDASNWQGKAGEGEYQALPLEGVAANTAVSVKYNGTKKVKSVKAVKKGGAEPVDNTYQKWDADQKKLIEVNFPATANKVQNADTDVNWQGTYVVEGEVTIGGQIQLTGDVDLIIKDGAKLTVNSYIYGSKNLRIYGQANQTGQLVVNCSNNDAIYNMTTLEVHSCQVTATSSADACGGFYSIGTFNVYGGSVDAKGTGTPGYGIGLIASGSMNIYGGEVKAEGKGSEFWSCGIFCDSSFNKATVTVYGGKLWAGCADKKAFNNVNLQKDAGFTGKTETCDNGTSWTEYTQADTPGTKYVRVGY